ncbi:hypothetical protein C359_00004 [Cryptococcus neoformans Bt120]|nr:hypothetical protein C359_00004 [Cryptococcus neoformans var. grubii Bt120]
MNSQDNEDSTSNSNDYDEFKILCDLYEQERTDEPRCVALEVWWWLDIRSKSTGRRAPTGQQRYSIYHGNILTVPWGSDSSTEGLYPNPNRPTLPELLKVQHRSLWLSIQKHLNPLSYPSPEAVVRLWRCRCEDDSVVYRQMLQRAFKMPVCETLHDWLSAQRTEARSQAEGTSFGRVSDGNEEEDDLSLVDGFYDPESLLETFTQSQDLEPTSI